MPLSDDQHRELHELAMDYRGAAIVTTQWTALAAFIEGLIDAQQPTPQVPQATASAEGVPDGQA